MRAIGLIVGLIFMGGCLLFLGGIARGLIQGPHNGTLQALKMEWIATLEPAALAIFLGSIGVNCVLGFWNPNWFGPGAVVGFPLSLAVDIAGWWCFYNLVKCPQCGGKINKFKNGKNVPRKQAWSQLEKLRCCKHCGWDPRSVEVGGEAA